MQWRERREVMAWWALVRSDLRVAKLVVTLEPPEWRAACFHAQQAGEKALKAVLEARDLPIPRTHDLTTLLQAVAAEGPGDLLIEACSRLTLYGVGPRYPGPSGEASDDDARDAIANAEFVVAWAESELDRLR